MSDVLSELRLIRDDWCDYVQKALEYDTWGQPLEALNLYERCERARQPRVGPHSLRPRPSVTEHIKQVLASKVAFSAEEMVRRAPRRRASPLSARTGHDGGGAHDAGRAGAPPPRAGQGGRCGRRFRPKRHRAIQGRPARADQGAARAVVARGGGAARQLRTAARPGVQRGQIERPRRAERGKRGQDGACAERSSRQPSGSSGSSRARAASGAPSGRRASRRRPPPTARVRALRHVPCRGRGQGGAQGCRSLSGPVHSRVGAR